MGIHGLWDIVAPAGVRVDPKTLEGRVVAVDSSIWIFQFIKALKTTDGRPQHGAHIWGFFRRICKLLYFRIRPVIVFDGPPPAVKKKTLLKRLQLRDQQNANFKKAAEKLIATRLKHLVIQRAQNFLASSEVTSVDPAGSLKSEACSSARPSTSSLDDTSDVFPSLSDDEDEALFNAASRRARRQAYYRSIPTEFTGFLSGRRRLDDIRLIDSQFGNVFSMPQQRKANASEENSSSGAQFRIPFKHQIFKSAEDFKEYRINSKNGQEDYVRLPLDSSVDPEVFDKLPPKLQYSILTQVRDAWINETRFQTVQAKDDAELLSNVQIESFIRHVRTAKELEKVKQSLSSETHQIMLQRLGGEADVPKTSENSKEINDSKLSPINPFQKKKRKKQTYVNKEITDEDLFIYGNRPLSSQSFKQEAHTPNVKQNPFLDWEDSIAAKNLLPSEAETSAVQLKDLLYEVAEQDIFHADEQPNTFKTEESSKFSESVRTIGLHVQNSFSSLSDDEDGWENIKFSSAATPPHKIVPIPPTEDDSITSITQEKTNHIERPAVGSDHYYSTLSIQPKLDLNSMNENYLSLSMFLDTESVNASADYSKVIQSPPPHGSLGTESPSPEISQTVQSSYFQNNFLNEDDIGCNGQVATSAKSKKDLEKLPSLSRERVVKKKATKKRLLSKERETFDASFDNMDVNSSGSTSTVNNTVTQGKSDNRVSDASIIFDLNEEESRFAADRFEQETELQYYESGSEYVTQDMIEDVKELLNLFGVPYITAPSEAEAQCAALTELNLCDAVISDDSDILAFGAKEVYRRFFDRTAVEAYFVRNLEIILGLERSHIIELAMLLGCDYTTGVRGVGVVNAIEAIKAFKGVDGLRKLKAWATAENRVSGDDGVCDTDTAETISYKRLHKNYRFDWVFPEIFPDEEVWKCFMKPTVDMSKEPFQWGIIQYLEIQNFLQKKCQVSTERINEILDPLRKELSLRASKMRQLRMTDFFVPVTQDNAIATFKSKRILAALKMLENHKCQRREKKVKSKKAERTRKKRMPRSSEENTDSAQNEVSKRSADDSIASSASKEASEKQENFSGFLHVAQPFEFSKSDAKKAAFKSTLTSSTKTKTFKDPWSELENILNKQ